MKKINYSYSNESGLIFDIAKFSLHDGPGIRTTIFLKGCCLECPWCHNPESISCQPELFFNEKTGMKRIIGESYTVNEIVNITVKDKHYYNHSNGGVTISGGEPFLQFDFLINLCKALKNNDIHVAIETSGNINKRKLLEISPYVDLFLLDYKHSNKELLSNLTNASYDLIEDNFKTMLYLKKRVVRRCLIIPTINDTEVHIKNICQMSIDNPTTAFEILMYHTKGISKYKSIGKEYILPSIPSNDNNDDINRLTKLIFNYPHKNISINGRQI